MRAKAKHRSFDGLSFFNKQDKAIRPHQRILFTAIDHEYDATRNFDIIRRRWLRLRHNRFALITGNMRLLTQNETQQRLMDLELAVVADQAHFSELVH